MFTVKFIILITFSIAWTKTYEDNSRGTNNICRCRECQKPKCVCLGGTWESVQGCLNSDTTELNLTYMKGPCPGYSGSNLQYLQCVDMTSLISLKKVNFTGNGINVIPTFTFRKQSELEILILANNRITHLQKYVFFGLDTLTHLDLSNNGLCRLSDGVFIRMRKQLDILNLQGNSLTVLNGSDFRALVIAELMSDYKRSCCLVGKFDKCSSRYNDMTSCNRYLVANRSLQVLMWIIGIGGLIANLYIIKWRTLSIDSNVQSLMTSNLALSDIIMSVYIIIIVGSSQHYGEEFIYSTEDWKQNFLCKFAGSIFTLSSEYSIVVLLLMSFHAATTVTVYPSVEFSRKQCSIILTFAFTACTIIGFLPLGPFFDANYYGRHPMCSPLPLTDEKFPGWQFALIIFLAFNLQCFFVIIGFLGVTNYMYVHTLVIGNRESKNEEGVGQECLNTDLESNSPGNEDGCKKDDEDVVSGNEDDWKKKCEDVDTGNEDGKNINNDAQKKMGEKLCSENDNGMKKFGDNMGTGNEDNQDKSGEDVGSENEDGAKANAGNANTINKDDGNVDSENLETNEPGMNIRCTPIVIVNACCWIPVILMGIVSQAGGWDNMPPGVYEWSTAFLIPVKSLICPFLYRKYLHTQGDKFSEDSATFESDPDNISQQLVESVVMETRL